MPTISRLGQVETGIRECNMEPLGAIWSFQQEACNWEQSQKLNSVWNETWVSHRHHMCSSKFNSVSSELLTYSCPLPGSGTVVVSVIRSESCRVVEVECHGSKYWLWGSNVVPGFGQMAVVSSYSKIQIWLYSSLLRGCKKFLYQHCQEIPAVALPGY